jgi:hypothetical protein
MTLIKLTKKSQTSSNKIKTHPENPEPLTPAKPDPLKLTPFVDKITIKVKVPVGPDAESMYGFFFSNADNPDVFLSSKKVAGYQIGKRVVLPSPWGQKSYPSFQLAYHSGLAKEFRLEFSPAALGADGMDVLTVALAEFIPHGWNFVSAHGRVTKMEVSVDIPNVEIADLNVLPPQTTYARTWGKAGRLETIVLGKTKGNQTRCYNRGAKRNAKGQFDVKYDGTRVERITKLNASLTSLHEYKNPFSGLQLVLMPTPPAVIEPKAYIWAMFLDSVAARTLPVALQALPPEKRTKYRAWLKENPVGWWDVNAIWAAWPKYLIESKLDPQAWKGTVLGSI